MATTVRRLASCSRKAYFSALAPIPRVSSTYSTIPSMSLSPSVSRLCTTSEARTQNLERIADEVLALDKDEYRQYVALLRNKLGYSAGAKRKPAFPEGKTAFDVKLEKFDPESKLKVIRAVMDSTDLDMKGAKDLLEEVPAVVKKGVSKEEAEKIIERLEEIGATVGVE